MFSLITVEICTVTQGPFEGPPVWNLKILWHVVRPVSKNIEKTKRPQRKLTCRKSERTPMHLGLSPPYSIYFSKHFTQRARGQITSTSRLSWVYPYFKKVNSPGHSPQCPLPNPVITGGLSAFLAQDAEDPVVPGRRRTGRPNPGVRATSASARAKASRSHAGKRSRRARTAAPPVAGQQGADPRSGRTPEEETWAAQKDLGPAPTSSPPCGCRSRSWPNHHSPTPLSQTGRTDVRRNNVQGSLRDPTKISGRRAQALTGLVFY